MTISLYRANPSDGANNLQQALGATMLRSAGSRFTHRPGKMIINWGSSGSEAQRLLGLFPSGNREDFLNHPSSVGGAVNKLTCLRRLQAANVSIVPFFERPEDAMEAINNGRARLYARTRLTGSSGEGIRLILNREDPQRNELEGIEYPYDFSDNLGYDYSSCNLFTMGIMGRRHEWRIHVINGTPVLSQLKLKRALTDRPQGYTSLIRNLGTGWIYSVNYNADEYPILERVQQLAVSAIDALGLDFGAVDIISRDNEVFVLEVNTAPGLADEGTAVQVYCDAFRNLYESRQVGVA